MSLRQNLFRHLNVAAMAAGLLAAVNARGGEDSHPWHVPTASGVTVPGLPAVAGQIHVDQFGYLPDERKIAVISDPQKGFNAGDHFTPGPEWQVRRVDSGAIVARGAPVVFNQGKTDRASGDRGWWFEFTDVRAAGDYYVFDPQNDRRSHVFQISPDVYRGVLRAAVRVFFYQREAFAHRPPFAEEPWVDEATYLQDKHARSLSAKNDPSTERDLSGGWMDAGDTNKYPTFLPNVLHALLYSWKENSAVFGDDFGIPESGNGLPDLLDEVKWELDWLTKMQDTDGGVFIKMGHVSYAGGVWPLSRDQRPRYYGPKASASTISAAGIFAHAARVYAQFPAWKEFSDQLAQRAEHAWQWYRTHPRTYNVDDGESKSGDADKCKVEQDALEAIAGFHLWALTAKPKYHDAFRAHYASLRQMAEPVWSPYVAGKGEALLEYTRQAGADRATVAAILARLQQSTGKPAFLPDESADLYRAWMKPTTYHWGSNIIVAGYGKVAIDALRYLDSGVDQARLRQRALDMAHSLHGVNPLGFVYLSNMRREGAEVSAMRIYHEWFGTGHPLAANPAPGYVTGGPNRAYAGSIKWLKRQPDTKCYADFNLGYPENSWELSEPAIYYQAMYVRLLTSLVPGGAQPVPPAK